MKCLVEESCAPTLLGLYKGAVLGQLLVHVVLHKTGMDRGLIN